VENGKRTDLPLKGSGRTYGKKADVPKNAWSQMGVTVRGALFTVSLNGQGLYDVEDTTFTAPGKVGVWTKADSVTYFDDFTIRPEVRRMKLLPVLAGVVVLVGAMACGGPAEPPVPEQKTVTVYVSTDRVFSEPILKTFEQRTGVRVNAVYDTEETKSTGLANRLFAEKENPQADVFWSNEPVRTLVLKERDALAPYQSPSAADIPTTFKDPSAMWTGFSARVRVIAYNTKIVPEADAPKSVLELADPRWKGQVAIADPRFGSTSFHVAALYVALGDQKADDFFRRLKANGVKIVSGNSVVRDMVVKGEVKVGLTDTDDRECCRSTGRADRDGDARQGRHGRADVAEPRIDDCGGTAPRPGETDDRLPVVARRRGDAGQI
jgi:hypothetical protein